MQSIGRAPASANVEGPLLGKARVGLRSFAVPGKVIAQHNYSAELVRRHMLIQHQSRKSDNRKLNGLGHIFTTLLPNSVGVGLKPSARLNSSV